MLLWLFPFAGGPVVSPDGRGAGWQWEENGFNEREGMWPPPDPDKLRWARKARSAAAAASQGDRQWGTPEEERAAFRARQAQDLRRRRTQRAEDIMAELEEVDGYEYVERGVDGASGWTNADGEKLRDYGVDEGHRRGGTA